MKYDAFSIRIEHLNNSTWRVYVTADQYGDEFGTQDLVDEFQLFARKPKEDEDPFDRFVDLLARMHRARDEREW